MLIGYADIVGDLLHLNHIKFFKECHKYCDYLIVGICSDEYSTKYKRPPILNENILSKKKPNYLILFSWHIKKELKKNLRKKGFKGKFIIPLPYPKIEN